MARAAVLAGLQTVTNENLLLLDEVGYPVLREVRGVELLAQHGGGPQDVMFHSVQRTDGRTSAVPLRSR